MLSIMLLFNNIFNGKILQEIESNGQDLGADDMNSSDYTDGSDNDTSTDSQSSNNDDSSDANTGSDDTGNNSDTNNDTGDSNSDDMQATDYTAEGDGSGDDDNGGFNDDSSSGSSDSSSSSSDSGDDQPVDDLKQKEEKLLSNLTPEQLDIKHKELKNNFLNMYDIVNNIIERISDISVNERSIATVEFISNQLSNLKDMIVDYLNTTYKTKSYIENYINYNRFMAVLNGINKLIEEMNKNAEK